MVPVWERLPAAASSAFDVAAAPEPQAQPREPATAAWRLGEDGLELRSRAAGDSWVTEVVLNDGQVVEVELGRAAQGEGSLLYAPTSSVSLDHPQTPRTSVTGVDLTVVARQECAAVGRSSGCDPAREERLDNGAVLTVWDVGDGEPFVTVALADWLLPHLPTVRTRSRGEWAGGMEGRYCTRLGLRPQGNGHEPFHTSHIRISECSLNSASALTPPRVFRQRS
jgi:hypothetical protein